MSDNRPDNRATIINSVQTPLGLFALLALIVDSILIAVSASTAKVSMWAPISILGLLILCIFIIVLINPKALFHPKDWPPDKAKALERAVKVIIDFPPGIDPMNVDLISDNCSLEIRDLHGTTKLRTRPDLRAGQDIWYLLLANIEPDDSVRMELVDSNNHRWKVLPFDPFENKQKARPIQQNVRDNHGI